MKKNKGIYLAFLLILLFIISGCGSNLNEVEDLDYKVIEDSIGRSVNIPNDPKRIAAIDSFTAEALIMSGAGDQMVCCPRGVKSDKLLMSIYEELSEKPVIQSGGSINAEALLKLNPELIFIKYGFYIEPEEIQKIEKLGIPYIVIKYSDTETQMAALKLISSVLSKENRERANKILDYYKDTIEYVKNKTLKIPKEERKSLYHSINGVTRTDGRDSLGADWTEIAGCKNVSINEKLLKEGDIYTAGKEQIFLWDPDVIICNEKSAAEFFCTSKMFSGLSAVRSNNVYNIPIAATRWGQQGSLETYFAMLWLGKTLYPEYYKDLDLEKEVCDFYKDIEGIYIDHETYKKILEGEGIRKVSKNKN